MQVQGPVSGGGRVRAVPAGFRRGFRALPVCALLCFAAMACLAAADAAAQETDAPGDAARAEAVDLANATGAETTNAANAAGAQATQTASTTGAEAVPPFPPPPGEGLVRGRVLHAERAEGIADLEVALYAFAVERVLGLARTRSDAEGRFQFPNISADPALSYLVGVRYQGVAHPGTRVRFAAGEREVEALVRVTELTDAPGALELSAFSLRVSREVGKLRIHQEVELRNTGVRSFYLPAARRSLQEPAKAAYSTTLPPGAIDFKMPLGVTPEGLLKQAGRLAWFGPVHPGRHLFAFSYALTTAPVSAPAPEVLRFDVQVPVDVPLTLLTPLHFGRVDAPGFSAAGAVERLSQGEHTRTLGRSDDGRITLAFELPPARPGGDAALLREVQVVLSMDHARAQVNENIALEITPGALALAGPEQPFFHLALPPRAENVRFAAEAPGLNWLPHAQGGLALVGAAGAGSYEVQVQYSLSTADAGRLNYRRSFSKVLPLLSLFVADSGDLALESKRLHRRRPLRSNDRNYLRLEAFELAPGEVADLELQRRPKPAFARGNAARGMALLLALGAVLYLALPLRRGARSPARTPAVSAAARERAALIETIRDLDHDLETGKLSAEDHEKWRSSMFEQAAALLAREREERAFFAQGAAEREAVRKCPAPADASEAPPAQQQPTAAQQQPVQQEDAARLLDAIRQSVATRQAAPRRCPRCAKPAESEAHRFCAWCGAQLPDAPRASGMSQADAPEAADAQDTPDTPGTAGVRDASETQSLTNIKGKSPTENNLSSTNIPSTHGTPGAPNSPNPPSAPSPPSTSHPPSAPNPPRPPSTPSTPNPPITPRTPSTPRSPSTPLAPDQAKRSDDTDRQS